MTFDLASRHSLGDAFEERVAARSDAVALTLHRGAAAEPESVTYAELARRARLRASALAARLAPGKRVILALPTGIVFAEYYLGCLMAGLVCVPVPAPGGSARAAERITVIAADCDPELIVAAESDVAALVDGFAGAGSAATAVEAAAPAGPGVADGLPADRPRPHRGTPAVIQYSSGSTGTPRGVVLAHGTILDNVQAMHESGGIGPDDRFGSWLPLHHDMGLFAMLSAPLVFGAPLALMAPSDFVRRPVEWLRMLDRYRVTVTAAPDFAFDLCLRAIPDAAIEGLDLSELDFLLDGSEPINAATIAAFSARFARAGLGPDVIAPCYGMAECTAYVSAKPRAGQVPVMQADVAALSRAEGPELRPTAVGVGRALVGCGIPSGDAAIVDPATRRALAPGRIGEIWLRVPGIGLGYWGHPELSACTFDVRLEDADAEGAVGSGTGGWLRTGDLGALIDGQLYITGRLKEVLIVRGRNLFPQDLEQHARSVHEALAGFVGAAFSVPAPDERIVLVHEVNPTLRSAEFPGVAAAVADCLTVEFGVPVRNILLVRRGSIHRTTSGKVQRTAMRERFLAGEITALHTELEPALLRVGAP
ncbi:fatty acyl-AMP ligase [Streptomyces sp. NBC_01235]|uniref:fatty acyl-AMP ligase n=1 Tax=Streptomyces sp. NBC_01235 TaxID=2903788 RepID=UPI002E0EAC88|nr:fatty acyl-AMP ligase [Streptomyces sp. NBC_01235]